MEHVRPEGSILETLQAVPSGSRPLLFNRRTLVVGIENQSLNDNARQLRWAAMASLFLLVILVSICSSARAESTVTINLDYKVLLDPTNGTRPAGISDGDLSDTVDSMNTLLRSFWRGYRFVVLGINEIGGPGSGDIGPNQWFNTNFFDENSGIEWKDAMELSARPNSQFLWRNDAINIYIRRLHTIRISEDVP